MQRLLNKKFIILSPRNHLQAQKNYGTSFLSFLVFSFFLVFLHLMCAFCKRYLTCTINMPSIFNVMLEHIHGKRIDYIIFHISDIGKNTFNM